MFAAGDMKGRAKKCLTLIFKVNHQGRVNDFGFSELLDIVNVRIDTKIKSASCIQPELRKVIQMNVCDLQRRHLGGGGGLGRAVAPLFFPIFQ